MTLRTGCALAVVFVSVLAVEPAFAAPKSAQVAPVSGDHTSTLGAYGDAVTCFVTNVNARGDRVHAGDKAKAAIYENYAQAAWNAAYRLGHLLSFPNERIEYDLAESSKVELATMMKDQSVFYRNVAKCKALGLM